MNDIKKDFQKTVKAIRDRMNAGKEYKSEYPKAMMTGQQMKKRTATINCGYGLWYTANERKERAINVMNAPEFDSFLARWNADADIEEKDNGERYTTIQVRIKY